MKLEKVKGNTYKHDPPTKCVCCNCHRTISDITTMYADLDGPPYSSYYCKECAFDEEDYLKGSIML